MKDKDFIIKTPAGLYLMLRENGTVGITNRKHATHFHTKTEVNKVSKQFRAMGYTGLFVIDLHKKNGAHPK